MPQLMQLRTVTVVKMLAAAEGGMVGLQKIGKFELLNTE
jgi:hypothetical protein